MLTASQTIACSDYHGMVAAGGVDGCVTWMNAARASTRARKAVRCLSNTNESSLISFFPREYRSRPSTGSTTAAFLDFIAWSMALRPRCVERWCTDCKTNAYQVPNHAARIYSQPIDAPKPKKPLTAGDWRTVSAGFPLEVQITKTAWQNNGGIGRAGMLASGSGSGICRIDFMQGHLYRSYDQSLAEDLGFM